MERWDMRDADRRQQRKHAERLKARGGVGEFFVRSSETKPGCLGLMVKTNGSQVVAFLIEQSPDWSSYYFAGSNRHFPTLVDLLFFYSHTLESPLPVLLAPLQLGSSSGTGSSQAGGTLDRSHDAQTTASAWAYAAAQGPSAFFPPHLPRWPAANLPAPGFSPLLTNAAALAQLEADSSPGARAAAQAQVELLQKQAAVAAARVRALETAVENARAGGGTERLATTMQAMGLHAFVPLQPPAVAGDSISAVLAATAAPSMILPRPLYPPMQAPPFAPIAEFAASPEMRSRTEVSEQMSSMQAHRTVAVPSSPSVDTGSEQHSGSDSDEYGNAASLGSYRTPQVNGEDMVKATAEAEERALRLSGEVEALLQQRLKLERDVATYAERALEQERALQLLQAQAAEATAANERANLLHEREKIQREMLQMRLALQQQQMLQQQHLFEQERLLQAEERRRLSLLLDPHSRPPSAQGRQPPLS